MVQLFVNLKGESNEWTIIELQGFLESNCPELSGLKIGDLHFDEKGNPTMIIGHHVLSGKVTVLNKPFAVMKKQKTEEHSEDISEENAMNISASSSYDVVAFVRKKIIFKNRPRPIITSVKPIKR